MPTTESNPPQSKDELQAAARAYLAKIDAEIAADPDSDLARHVQMNDAINAVADEIAKMQRKLKQGNQPELPGFDDFL